MSVAAGESKYKIPEEILHTNTSKGYVFLGSGTTAAFLPGILNKGGGNSIVTFARLSVAFRMQVPVASEKIPLTTHCEESVALLSFLAEIQNCHCVVPDLKQKHKQVSGFQGSKRLCLSSTGDPCSALCSLLPSQRGGLRWCPGAQHCIWESSPIHLILTMLPFWWMRTGLQWAYSEQRADGRRALNTSAVRQDIPCSSSRGSGIFLSISWSAGIKLWPLRSHCFPCIW